MAEESRNAGTSEALTLTPEQKRVRIAELCGYERIDIDYESERKTCGYTKGEDGVWRTPSANKWNVEIEAQNVKCVGHYFVELATKRIYADFDGPDTGDYGQGNFDYLNDLNAMHAAEEALATEHDRIVYKETLADITPKDPAVSLWGLCHATAAQRADAFLLTLDPAAEA